MKYRKRPVVIEAFQFNGEDNCRELLEWMNGANSERLLSPIAEAWYVNKNLQGLLIKTAEGTMTACLGDYIIRGIKGEFYPCKPDIFAATYETVKS